MTIVETRQLYADWYKQEVCRILGWTEEQYTSFQHQQGLAYLHWYCNCLEDYKRALEGSKVFWAWWRNCWLGRDMAFCEDAELININTRRELYKCLNDEAYLVADIKPSKTVMDSVNLKLLVHG